MIWFHIPLKSCWQMPSWSFTNRRHPPPSPPLSLHLPPILPSCHSTPICPIPTSPHSLTHIHTHIGVGWQDFSGFQPRLPAHVRGSRPPARRAAGHRGQRPARRAAPHGAFGNRSRYLKSQPVPTRAGSLSPSATDRAAVLSGTPGAHLPQGIPGNTSWRAGARQQFARCCTEVRQRPICKLTALRLHRRLYGGGPF